MTRAMLVGLGFCVLIGACGEPRPGSDQDAFNREDTGAYDVIGESVQGRDAVFRVKVEDMDQASEIAADLIEMKKPMNYRTIRLEFIGPDDAVDASARQVVEWSTTNPTSPTR